MRVLMAVIPLATVPPGDVVMRANVSVDGQPAGRVVRTLRKAGQ
jgi:5-enolpyruvylshikimate-3-phosphate synthase